MNLSLMKLLSGLLSSDWSAGSRQGREANAGLLLGGAIWIILLCALSDNAVFPFSVIAVFLLLLAFMESGAIARVLRTTLLSAGAAGIFMLPAAFLGSPRSFGTVVMKVFESVLVLSVLREYVSWKELTSALGRWHLPGILVMTLDMTVRFLVLLGRHSHSILEAVSLRRVGDQSWRNAGTGGIFGTTFLEARHLAEQTGEAMLCRGWDGSRESVSPPVRKAGKRAMLLAWSLYALLLVWFVLTQSWMSAG